MLVKRAPRWDDLRFPVTSLNLLTGAQPDPEASTGMLLFDAAGTESITGIAQMPHSWRENSAIVPHVHWQKTTSAGGNVYWRLAYEIINNGDVAAMDYGTTIDQFSVVSGITDSNTAHQALISSFGEIDMTGYKISCLILFKLSRLGGEEDDSYGADARLLEFDIHYELDSLGSNTQFVKQLNTYNTTEV